MHRRATYVPKRNYEPNELINDALKMNDGFSNDFRSVYNNIEKALSANPFGSQSLFMEPDPYNLPNILNFNDASKQQQKQKQQGTSHSNDDKSVHLQEKFDKLSLERKKLDADTYLQTKNDNQRRGNPREEFPKRHSVGVKELLTTKSKVSYPFNTDTEPTTHYNDITKKNYKQDKLDDVHNSEPVHTTTKENVQSPSKKQKVIQNEKENLIQNLIEKEALLVNDNLFINENFAEHNINQSPTPVINLDCEISSHEQPIQPVSTDPNHSKLVDKTQKLLSKVKEVQEDYGKLQTVQNVITSKMNEVNEDFRNSLGLPRFLCHPEPMGPTGPTGPTEAIGPAVWNREHDSKSGGIPMGPCVPGIPTDKTKVDEPITQEKIILNYNPTNQHLNAAEAARTIWDIASGNSALTISAIGSGNSLNTTGTSVLTIGKTELDNSLRKSNIGIMRGYSTYKPNIKENLSDVESIVQMPKQKKIDSKTGDNIQVNIENKQDTIINMEKEISNPSKSAETPSETKTITADKSSGAESKTDEIKAVETKQKPVIEPKKWPQLSADDVNTSFKVLESLKDGQKLVIVNDKYLAVDTSLIPSLSRGWNNQGRDYLLNFLDHLFEETKRIVEITENDIKKDINFDDNVDAMKNLIGRISGFLTSFEIMQDVYKGDSGVRARFGVIKSKFYTFLSTYFRKLYVPHVVKQ